MNREGLWVPCPDCDWSTGCETCWGFGFVPLGRDAAIERMARRFDRFFSTKYTDEDLREIAADLLDAAGGERT